MGGRVSAVYNVLGNDDDLARPRTLERIDAVCKAPGYVAKTHPAIAADEYANLVPETTRILSSDSRRRPTPAGQREA